MWRRTDRFSGIRRVQPLNIGRSDRKNVVLWTILHMDGIIGMLEIGRQITDVPKVFRIVNSVVFSLSEAFRTSGQSSRRKKEVVYAEQRPEHDPHIVLKSKRNSHSTTGQMASKLFDTQKLRYAGKLLQSVCGRQDNTSVTCCVLPLVKFHRSARSQWCCQHLHWSEDAGLISSSQMRVSSVFLLIVEGKLFGVKFVVNILHNRKRYGACRTGYGHPLHVLEKGSSLLQFTLFCLCCIMFVFFVLMSGITFYEWIVTRPVPTATLFRTIWRARAFIVPRGQQIQMFLIQ